MYGRPTRPNDPASIGRPHMLRRRVEVAMTRHTDREIEQATQRFEQLADELDPETVEAERTDDLREIAAAAEAVRADDVRLREAVTLARAHGRL